MDTAVESQYQPGIEARPNNSNRQIAQYSLVATVAGVSVLALAQPAAGEVLVTKKTIPIPLAPVGVREPVKISMANNGNDSITMSAPKSE